MAWFQDSLRAAIAALNPFTAGRPQGSCLPNVFTHQLAIAAYMSSGMLRKTIAIPADDRVREWRDWQADKEQIEAIEAEEKRLGIAAKVKFAEILRGIGGGALVLITKGSPEEELRPETIGKDGLLAVNPVSRWQVQGVEWVENLADPDYGKPRMFKTGTGGGEQLLHPSRVVCFRGDPLPAGAALRNEDVFWGDSKLMRVFTEVQKSDNAHLWFSELVKKAKLLRIGIPDLADMMSTNEGRQRLQSRVQLIAEGESTLNATVYRSAAGPDGAGETIGDYQITWNGIPAMMDAFDQRVAAVADIPFTRLMGRSPAGMNATGEHDNDNWNKMVVSGQKLELRPCLDQIDAALLPSAGVAADKVTWRFAPLGTPSEKEEAETFKATMEAVEKLQATGAIPDEAFAEGLQNLMSEREWMPGLDQALAKVPEAERYGLTPEVDPNEADPNALVAEPVVEEEPRRRAANDKKDGEQ